LVESNGETQMNVSGNISNTLSEEQLAALISTLNQSLGSITTIVSQSLSNVLGGNLNNVLNGGLANLGNLANLDNLSNVLNGGNLTNLLSNLQSSNTSTPLNLTQQLGNILPKFTTATENGTFKIKVNDQSLLDLDLSQFINK